MTPDIKRACIYSSAVVVVALAWYGAEVRKAEVGRYSLESVDGIHRTFLLDRKTGKIWRHYIDLSENRELRSEGFSPIFSPTDFDPTKPFEVVQPK